jgi:hypothetical protein
MIVAVGSAEIKGYCQEGTHHTGATSLYSDQSGFVDGGIKTSGNPRVGLLLKP